MMTRRKLIQVSAALATSPAVLAHAKQDVATLSAGLPLCATVIDSGSKDARAFGRAAAARSLSVHAIGRDLADVYFGELVPRWRQYGPTAVAGLTGIAPLFCLERLAWDVDLRIVFLGRHEIAGDAPARHVINGPKATVNAFRAAARVLDWHIALAHSLNQIPVATPALRPLSAVRDAAIVGDPALFSWVLAPVKRAARSDHDQVLL
jgi:hypothetical protein